MFRLRTASEMSLDSSELSSNDHKRDTWCKKIHPTNTSKQLLDIRTRKPNKKEVSLRNLAIEIASDRKGSSLEY